ncbi:translocation/assembly module TamB domain-containing protein [Aureivirga sp. CE67]|uniref:translocation/assembly module TamB domain-containing protein n=1 Tax=Aureivirga sp. CE67 TaxID=1788983 RepID=UPI0018C963E2|nr:translocation/assembly module TamB domain-containing protein [Aureivirga sp. CE67]
MSILLAIPAVQTFLGKKASNFLDSKYGVSIVIEKIDLSLLGSVKFKNIQIDDHHQDTLIHVSELKTTVMSYRNILNSKLNFEEVDLSGAYFYMTTYKGESESNLQKFVDAFSSDKPKDSTSQFELSFTNISLYNGNVRIQDLNSENKPLTFNKITGDINDFKVEGSNVYGNLRNVAVYENDRLDVKNLTTDFTYTNENMLFENTTIATETSDIHTDIIFSYKKEDLKDFVNKVNIKADVMNSNLSLIDLNKLYGELGKDDNIHFSSKLNGTLNNLFATKLILNSDRGTIIDGDFHFKGIFNKERNFKIIADMKHVASNYDNLKNLLPQILGEKLPTVFQDLGFFEVNGEADITREYIGLDIVLQTEIGEIDSELMISNIRHIDDASYKGRIKVKDFELGKVVNDPKIGQISLDADVDGKGFTIEDLDTSIEGKITKHEYLGYMYQNIKIDGEFKKRVFIGKLNVNDPNFKMKFNGQADLSLKVYKYDFKAEVEHADFNKLHLFTRDSISEIRGDIAINVEGNSVENMQGTVRFTNSFYKSSYDSYTFKDFEVSSTLQDSTRTITINSPDIIDGRMKGHYFFKDLPHLLINTLGSKYTNFKPYDVKKGQYLDFNFNIHSQIVEVFFPKIKIAPKTVLKGTIDEDKDLIQLSLDSPSLDIYDNLITSVRFQLDSNNPLYNTQLAVKSVDSKYYDISNLNLVNKILNDTLFFRTGFKGGKNNTEKYNLSFYHTIDENNNSVIGFEKSNFKFNDRKWLINPNSDKENKVIFDLAMETFDFKKFQIESGNQLLEFFGQIKDSKEQDLNFNFNNVHLENITPKSKFMKLAGVLNGEVSYKKSNKEIIPQADITIDNFEINDTIQGNVNVNITGQNSFKKYEVNAKIDAGGYDSFSARGHLDFEPEKPEIDLNLQLNKFNLIALKPFGNKIISNIRGEAYTNLEIHGPLENPDINGGLFLDKAGAKMEYLGVDYDFQGTSVIEFYNQTIDIQDVRLKDTKKGTKGELYGTVSHQKFKDWDLNLHIQTPNLLVLDTKPQEDSRYYGTGYLDGNAQIVGKVDNLEINVNGKTMPGTNFVIPVSDVKTVSASNLLVFTTDEESNKSAEKQNEILIESLKGTSLNFNLEITKDAEVEMILDQSSGSTLKGSGTGNLQIEINTNGKFNMYGDFTVEKGVYNLIYGGVINKPFEVQKGGTISWSGNPLDAEINIEAIYRVLANPQPLLENINTARKVPIDLITRFSGKLFDSTKEFDIQIPNSSSVVSSELAFKLNDNDPNNKLRQFISLLITGSFFDEDNFGVNGTLTSTGYDILSSILTNILNNGDEKVKIGIEYTAGDDTGDIDRIIEDQLGISLQTQINDKIIINGKVGVPVESRRETTVIGELKVEFLLNEDGSFRATVFNRQNEIQYEEEEGYTQGAGLTYTVDFNTGRELLKKLKLAKAKDSTKQKKKKKKKKKKKDKNKPVDPDLHNNPILNFE